MTTIPPLRIPVKTVLPAVLGPIYALLGLVLYITSDIIADSHHFGLKAMLAVSLPFILAGLFALIAGEYIAEKRETDQVRTWLQTNYPGTYTESQIRTLAGHGKVRKAAQEGRQVITLRKIKPFSRNYHLVVKTK